MNTPKIAIRISSNPNHHLWNNNGTWWLHYTEHLPDYTKRRVRISLHTHNVRAARAFRDVLLTWDAPNQAQPRARSVTHSAQTSDAGRSRQHGLLFFTPLARQLSNLQTP